MSNQAKANLVMLLVTLCWGSSYLFMKMGLTSIEGFNLIALRFGIAFLLAGSLFYKRLIRADLKTIRYGLILGALLFAAFVFIVFGVKYTSTSNAGFLISLTVIFVPLLSAFFFKKVPEKKVWAGVFLALLGIGLLTLNDRLSINMGDTLCILGSVVYALYILVTGHLTKSVDSVTLGVIQLGAAGLLGLLFSLALETPRLPASPQSWAAILALSILCSAIGFIGQTAAQKYTTPTHAGLVFSLEPVFAALFAFLYAGETLSPRGYIGAAIVLLGVLNTEVDLKKLLSGSKLPNNIPSSVENQHI